MMRRGHKRRDRASRVENLLGDSRRSKGAHLQGKQQRSNGAKEQSQQVHTKHAFRGKRSTYRLRCVGLFHVSPRECEQHEEDDYGPCSSNTIGAFSKRYVVNIGNQYVRLPWFTKVEIRTSICHQVDDVEHVESPYESEEG